MKLSPKISPLVWSLFAAAFLVLAGPAVAQVRVAGRQVTVSFPDAVAQELTLSLHVDHEVSRTSELPALKVELHNAGQHNLLVNLGTMTSDGAHQYPSAVTFVLAGPDGKPQVLTIKASVNSSNEENEPLLLALPAGATFSFPVDLGNYWILGSNGFNSKLPPGKYVIEAQFTDLTSDKTFIAFPWCAACVIEQPPREMPISGAPFDNVNSQGNGAPTSNELHLEIAR